MIPSPSIKCKSKELQKLPSIGEDVFYEDITYTLDEIIELFSKLKKEAINIKCKLKKLGYHKIKFCFTSDEGFFCYSARRPETNQEFLNRIYKKESK